MFRQLLQTAVVACSRAWWRRPYGTSRAWSRTAPRTLESLEPRLLLSGYAALTRPTELQYWDPTLADNGYNFYGAVGTSYLLDMEGRVVHTWPVGTNPHLLSNGDVLDAATNDPSGYSGFKEVDWNGNTMWSYLETRSTYHPHHDFTRIFNPTLNAYTTLYIANKDLTYDQLIAAGADPSRTPSTGAQMDAIVEVDSSGAIVWEWCFFDHLVQDYDATKANYVATGKTISDYPNKLNINLPGHNLKADWLHCNSLDYNQSLDQIVVNSVQGEFYVIDHGGTFVAGNPTTSIANAATSAGDFLYRFGDPARYGQGTTPAILEDWTQSTTGTKQLGGAHDIQWIADGLTGAGQFLIFNNAEYLSEHTAQSYVMEINPYLDASGTNTGHYVNPPDAGYNTVTSPAVTDKASKLISRQVVWTYASQSNLTLYSQIGCSAQRLSNGNTLICADTEGYIMEVTPSGKTVWDYIVPVTNSGPVLTIGDNLPMVNSIFRAYRYEASNSAFAGRTLTAGATIAGRTTVSNPYAGTSNYETLQRQTETQYWDAAAAYNGYTFFAAQGTSYLIDMQGRTVHTWATGTDPRLLVSGHVLDWATNVSGNTGLIELDWDGNTVWQYYETRTKYHPHGAFRRIYDPKLGAYATLYLANKDVTAAECLAAGCDPADAPFDGAQVDTIVEVDMSGNIVWEWSFWDHGIQSVDATKANYVGTGKTIADYPGKINLNLPGRPLQSNWLDCNSLDFNQSLNQIVVNSRQGEFYIIDHGNTFLAGDPVGSIALAATTAGDFLYRFGDPARYSQGNAPSVGTNWETASSGNKQIGGSSDVQWIPAGLSGAGHLLVFDNNQYLYQRTPQSYVFEINPYLNSSGTDTGAYVNPPTAGYTTWTFDKDTMKANQLLSKQVVWKYGSVSNLTLFSHLGSSAQRLPNGNTLICATTTGYMVEVDASGNVVWEYINPVTNAGIVTAIGDCLPMTNAVPRATRYAASFAGLQGHTLSAGATIAGTVYPTIAGTTVTPGVPTSSSTPWITSTITAGNSIASAKLTYIVGSGTGAQTTPFTETFGTTTVKPWTGSTGANNAWTISGTSNPFELRTGANYVTSSTACGLEFKCSVATSASVATTSGINAAGTSGSVQFYMQTLSLPTADGWAFQTDATGTGTNYVTRLSEAGTSHAFQSYTYTLTSGELVNGLKMRFVFTGGGTSDAGRIDLDQITLTLTAGGAITTTATMYDDGAHGDGLAGDKVYGAQIPAMANGTAVSYYVTATDSKGLTTSDPAAAPATNYSYAVQADLAPTDIALSAGSVAENQTAPTTVGTLTTTDPDSGNTFTYSLVSGTGSTDNASFSLSGNSLVAAARFDYETKNSYSIRVRSTDQSGLYTEKVFTISVADINEAPTLDAIANQSVGINSGTHSITLTGISAGLGESQNLTVSATASNPTLFSSLSATYSSPATSGTLQYTLASGATGNATVTVTVTDDGGTTNGGMNSLSRSFVVQAQAATIAGRRIFYNNSYFDGDNAAANAGDDSAIDTTKSALLLGQTASFANYTGYSKGINGIMVDIANLANAADLAVADFDFKVGNSNTPSIWSAAPAPSSVTVRAGAGTGGSDRVTILWDDGAIAKEWLQVTVKATANTGLSTADIFYFGNAVGETGNSATNAYVDGTDFVGVRDHERNFVNRAAVSYAYDLNKDSFVDGTDLIIERDNTTNFAAVLKLITPTADLAPTDISLSASIVAENQTSGATVGTLSTTDPDSGNTFTYSLVGGTGSADNASFTLKGGTLVTAASFDYETKSSYSIRIRSTDQDGLSIEKPFTISVTNVNEAPTIATAATATPNPATGTTALLTVRGADVDTGEGTLLYTWTATTVPAGSTGLNFSANGSNAAKSSTATFSVAGNYVFLVTIADPGGLTVTGTVSLTVDQTLTTIAVSPSSTTVNTGATQQFTATAKDQFGSALTVPPTFAWTTTVGTITTAGLLTAPNTPGSGTVSASSGSITGNASVTISSQSHPYTMAALPDTGQVASYSTLYGEDADYTLHPPTYQNNGDGTITDKVTGLMWQQVDGGEMTWEQALAYADSLALGGYTDWRLPYGKELFSILDQGTINPAMNTAFFTASAAEYWWSSDVSVDDSAKVWVANAGGGIGPHPKSETVSAGGSRYFHVRCVRDPSASGATHLYGDLTDNGDGTVTDNHTELVWQQAESSALTWEEALAYAESLTLAGHGDWRLPNIKELQSISDTDYRAPSLNKTYFPGATATRYWSSTSLANDATKAWYLDADYGLTTYDVKTGLWHVRCVRGGTAASLSVPTLQVIPQGSFVMGDHFNFVDPGHQTDELPLHTVSISAFSLGTYDITNRQYCDYLNSALAQGLIEVRNGLIYAPGGTTVYAETRAGEAALFGLVYSGIDWNGSAFSVLSGRDNHPVAGIRWEGAAAYCNWLSALQGYQSCYNLTTWATDFTKNGYRLPTEAEWEYAANGGNTDPYYQFPWGSNTNTDGTWANWENSGDPYETGDYPWTTPVGFYDGTLHLKSDFNWPGSQTSYQTSNAVNGYGLYDMGGNIWQWTNDWYSANYYSVSPSSNPTGPTTGDLMPDGVAYHGMRGGQWYNGSQYYGMARISNRDPGYYRGPQDPNHPYYHVGFRVALKSSSLVQQGATDTTLVSTLQFGEGPATDASGNVYFSDIKANTIYKWSVAGQLSTFRTNSGGASGLAVDASGNVIACEGTNGRVVSISPQGVVTVLASQYNGMRFNEPNDLWLAPNGGIYFTDPVFFGTQVQDVQAVYYINPSRTTVTRVISDMTKPNGLVGTADGTTLYVSDYGAGATYKYTINSDGTLTGKTLFVSVGSDGMEIDSDGNVYLTSDDVLVYNSAGTKIQTINVLERPTNLCFAGADRRTLFITTETALYSIAMRTQGLGVTLANTAPAITGTTRTPATPSSTDAVWVTSTVTDNSSVASVKLTYAIGTGTGTTTTPFTETMGTTAVKPWTGSTGANNAWTITGSYFELRTGANYVTSTTACGMEYKSGGTLNTLTSAMAATTNSINAAGTSGYVEFWLQSLTLDGTDGWTFQLDSGSGYVTRLSELTGSSHGWQKYQYTLASGELVSTLKMRFQFTGGGTGDDDRIDLDQITVSVTSGSVPVNVTMYDDGLHGDGTSGDHVYGGQIPAMASGTTVIYYVTATDNAGLSTTDPATAPTDKYAYIVGRATPQLQLNEFLAESTTFTATTDYPAQTLGVFINTASAMGGYTLLDPMHGKTTYLIDNTGQVVHTWTSEYEPGRTAYLMPNGHLFRACMAPGGLSTGGGEGGRIEERDWDGNLVWYINYASSTYMMHHDFKVLPNGNIIMLVAEKKLYADVIAAGFNHSLLDAFISTDGFMVPDSVVEIQPTGSSGGTVVWQWHVWDHLIQDYSSTKANYGVVAQHPELIDANGPGIKIPEFWNHINGIDYNAALDQIMLSARNQNELWIIDHSTTTAEAAGHSGGVHGKGGDLLYRWGDPRMYDAGTVSNRMLYEQHNTQWIASDCPGAGDILIFNNGLSRPPGAYSSIDEFTPPVDASGNYALTTGSAYGPSSLTWTYVASPAASFYSAEISGTERLPNGNTLICEGLTGRIFEVTSAGQIVWQYQNPVCNTGILDQGSSLPSDPRGGYMTAVFRALKYPATYAAFTGRTLLPSGTVEVYPDWIEIRNPSDSAIDLGGMYLTNDTSAPTKYQIPSGVSIPAGGYLLFWADNNTTAGTRHMNFTLSATGGTISLYDIDGITRIDTVTYGAQTTNVSYGRNGSGAWQAMTTVTPGSANTVVGSQAAAASTSTAVAASLVVAAAGSALNTTAPVAGSADVHTIPPMSAAASVRLVGLGRQNAAWLILPQSHGSQQPLGASVDPEENEPLRSPIKRARIIGSGSLRPQHSRSALGSSPLTKVVTDPPCS